MSDFDSIFGTGADIDVIIDDINTHNEIEYRNNYYTERAPRADQIPGAKLKYIFLTYKEASDWSKKYNGKAFKRNPEGVGFVAV